MLFQVHFLSLLLEERGAGSLAEVAEHVRQKLIRRHPHVFGEVEVEHAGEVLRNWDAIKRERARARAGDLRRGAREPARPAVRAQGPAARRHLGFDFDHVPYDAIEGELEELARRRATATRPSTRSATCCSPRSTSRAS